MVMLSKFELLRRVPFFSLLPQETLQEIASVIVKQRYRKGELLIRQAERCKGFFIIISGEARVIRTDEQGREVILASLGAGDYFGEMSVIDGLPASASIQFDTQADVLMLPVEEFRNYLPAPGSMADGLLQGFVTRLRVADKKIQSLALLDVYERVEHALYELARERDGDWVISGKLSRQDIAKMIGASREMVSRVMRELEKNEFYQVQADGCLLLKPRSEHNAMLIS